MTIDPRNSAETPELPSPAVLVVAVSSADAAEQLQAAVPQAQRQDARLVVALTMPRSSFTTDAVVALHFAARENDDLVKVQRILRWLLAGTDITADVVVVKYLSSRFASTRRRRAAAAVARMARRRGGVVLADQCSRAPASVVVRAPSEQGACLAAVLPDSVEAVGVAEAAAELARAADHLLVLVVPVSEAEFSFDPVRQAQAHGRVNEDTAAVAGRVRPTLDRFALTAQVRSAPYRNDGTVVPLQQSMANAIDKVCRGVDAQVVVVSAACPALPHLRTPAVPVHLIPARTITMVVNA